MTCPPQIPDLSPHLLLDIVVKYQPRLEKNSFCSGKRCLIHPRYWRPWLIHTGKNQGNTCKNRPWRYYTGGWNTKLDRGEKTFQDCWIWSVSWHWLYQGSKKHHYDPLVGIGNYGSQVIQGLLAQIHSTMMKCLHRSTLWLAQRVEIGRDIFSRCQNLCIGFLFWEEPL